MGGGDLSYGVHFWGNLSIYSILSFGHIRAMT